MSSVVSFDSQRSQDAALDVKGMATQLGINLAISIGVLMGFQLLRPKNSCKLNEFAKLYAFC